MLNGPAKQLRIYIGEADKWHGRPLVEELVQRLRAEGVAGVTVLRGVEGFGANTHIHKARLVELSADLPLVLEVVDTPEMIERVLPIVDEMVGASLVTIADVDVVHYRSTPSRDRE
jgi:PII-like signaling protein